MKEQIRTLYLSGLSYNQIAKQLNISKSTINYHCSDISRGKAKITKQQVIEINNLYNDGFTVIEVGLKLDIKPSTVFYYIKEKRPAPIVMDNKSKRIKVLEYIRKIKQQCVDYKGGKCIKCGYNKCLNSLDFHHIDPNTKEFTISGGTKSFEKLKPELDKCILLCRNCHGEEHEYKLD